MKTPTVRVLEFIYPSPSSAGPHSADGRIEIDDGVRRRDYTVTLVQPDGGGTLLCARKDPHQWAEQRLAERLEDIGPDAANVWRSAIVEAMRAVQRAITHAEVEVAEDGKAYAIVGEDASDWPLLTFTGLE